MDNFDLLLEKTLKENYEEFEISQIEKEQMWKKIDIEINKEKRSKKLLRQTKPIAMAASVLIAFNLGTYLEANKTNDLNQHNEVADEMVVGVQMEQNEEKKSFSAQGENPSLTLTEKSNLEIKLNENFYIREVNVINANEIILQMSDEDLEFTLKIINSDAKELYEISVGEETKINDTKVKVVSERNGTQATWFKDGKFYHLSLDDENANEILHKIIKTP